MKIGIDARLWNETGVGRYLRALVNHLQVIDTRNDYVVFVRPQEFETIKFQNSRWTKILAKVHWHTIYEQLEMPKLYRTANLDLLHIPYFSVPLTTPQPFIVTIHDLTISHHATGKATTLPYPLYQFKRLGYSFVLSQAVKRAARIITVSQTVKQDIIREFAISPDKVSVTYESGELEEKTDTSVFSVPKKYILYVGNAHPHKNLSRLVEAYLLIRKRIPELRLVCIGKHDYFYTRLQTDVAKSLAVENVIFPGEVSNAALVRWYRHAAAFVFPSLAEGFGIPGLEAMQFSCPVLASDIPVFREIYGGAANYFDQTDVVDMADEITSILKQDKLRRTLISLGKTQVKKYSWKKMAKSTLSLYESCALLRSPQ